MLPPRPTKDLARCIKCIVPMWDVDTLENSIAVIGVEQFKKYLSMIQFDVAEGTNNFEVQCQTFDKELSIKLLHTLLEHLTLRTK